jgi:hypothetical protein
MVRFWSPVPLVSMIAFALYLQSAFSASGKDAPRPQLVFSCSKDNDLLAALTDAAADIRRFDTPQKAIQYAPPNTAVLILADKYPMEKTSMGPDSWTAAQKKNLRMFLEYPKDIPGFETTAPTKTVWERGVVTSDAFGSALPKHRILAINDCHFLSMNAANPLLVTARVAGYDKAVYGLPPASFPVLFEVPDRNLFVATTKLSGFVKGRHAPAEDWKIVWKYLLGKLAPDLAVADLPFTPLVYPAYKENEKLKPGHEAEAFRAAAQWYADSRLLIPKEREKTIHQFLAKKVEWTTMPLKNDRTADGSWGILEGYRSDIQWDGLQKQLMVIRADCNAESAMALALEGSINKNQAHVKIARNLFDYVYFKSSMHGGARGNPEHPAFGLVSWGAISPAWEIANYSEDNARVMMSTMLAAACLNTTRWNESLLKALLANLRTTGKLGFRGDRTDMPDLEQRGWKSFHEADTVNYSPHFEAYSWACYLWAYRQTGLTEFLEKAKTAITMTMKAYPDRWRLGDSTERARMLLALAWLVRVEDTPEHRAWVDKIATDILARQQPCGGIQEWLVGTGGGHYQIPQSNEAFGTGETPLIQENGDPVTDQLYANGFAFLGLHEAAAATGDAKLKAAEDKLAEYLCRIQTRSPKHPWLNGSWFRAFDYKRWDYWASSADAGWGPWCLESGWHHGWITAVFGLRVKGENLWDYTKNSTIKDQLPEVQTLMNRNDGTPWKGKPWGQ